MFRDGQLDLFVATRGRPSDPFGMFALLADLNTPSYEQFASVTADGLTIYFESNRRLSGFAIYTSKRGSTSEAFPSPTELTELSVDGDIGGTGAPYLTADGGAVYFHAHLNGSYYFDVYRAQKTATGFAAPEWQPINTSESEGRPVVSSDELTIYYYHDYERSDPTAPGGIWMATRTSVTEPFGPRVSLKELNTLFQHPYPFWISPDGCRLYFGNLDSQNIFHVYVAERNGVSRDLTGTGGTGAGSGGVSGTGGAG